MNKIFLTGRLTKDIELKGNENKFLNNTIAVYDGKDKNNQDITYFYDFKAFNYNATKLSSQAQKGSKIAIEGVLKQDIKKILQAFHYVKGMVEVVIYDKEKEQIR